MRKFLNKIKPVRFVLVGLMALCASAAVSAGSPVLDRVVKNGVLKVATSGDQPPFNAVSRDQSLIGFDIDLANALAGAMKVKVEFVRVPFGDLMATLESGKADMIISGMAITPERTREISFIGPYMMSGKSILVSAATQTKVKTGADFNKPEITLLALENSTSQSFVERKLPNAKLKTIENYDDGVQMVIAGKADAMVADMPACKLSILRNPNSGLAVLEPPLSIEPVGIAVSAKDAQFQNLVRNYLSTFEKIGLTTQLRQKWFENSAWIAALP